MGSSPMSGTPKKSLGITPSVGSSKPVQAKSPSFGVAARAQSSRASGTRFAGDRLQPQAPVAPAAPPAPVPATQEEKAPDIMEQFPSVMGMPLPEQLPTSIGNINFPPIKMPSSQPAPTYPRRS